MISHFDWGPESLMETPGSPDMPNQFSVTYEVVNQVRSLTPEKSTIFMPPGDWKDGAFRSAAIQRLYPRTIHFGDDADFAKALEQSRENPDTYFVTHEKWRPHLCLEKSSTKLIGSGFGFCKRDG